MTSKPHNLIGNPENYEHIVSEMSVSVSCTLAESTIANLQAAYPWATLTGGVLSIGNASQSLLRQYAGELQLIPMDPNAETIILPVAIPVSSFDGAYIVNKERVIKVEFKALPVSVTDLTLIEFW
jgi:hypothetical protein